MTKDNIIEFKNPAQDVIQDQLTEFLRVNASELLKAAIEAEVNELINRFKDDKIDNKQRIVRNGYLPERSIQTGIGEIEVKVPRVRDRSSAEQKVIFESELIPRYMKRTATIETMLPILYLKGISTNDFPSVLSPIFGDKAKNLSPNVISNLKKSWYQEFLDWQNRSLSNKKFVYLWADGVYLRARSESDKTCMLVIIGADEFGNKEVLALCDGFRESKESWRALLLDLKSRGLEYQPHLAIGDGALGFWGAINEVYPKTKHQRCWVHKTANILDKLPKSQHATAKSMIHEIYLSSKKKTALKAFNRFINKYEDKYPKAAENLLKDKQELMNFYDFPAGHWRHIRTTNPIESTFATVKHRTRKSRGCFSRETIVASTFKLLMEAQKRWKKLYGYKKLADVINLVKFIDGIDERTISDKSELDKAA